MGKYPEKCLYVNIREFDRIINNLKRNVKRLRERVKKEGSPDRLMNADGVAELIGCHKYHVYTLIQKNGLPCMKLSERKYRFKKEEVEEWMVKRQGDKEINRQRDKEANKLGD